MSKQSHASKTPSSAAPAPSRRPVIEPAPALETPAAGLALEVAADHLSPPLAQRAIQQLGYVHGNRQLSRRVSVVQRHPGHGDEPPLQRAILMADPTQIATVNVAAAPLPLRRSRRGP
nr:hypothetical protein [Anaerolineales bacterium]